MRTAPATDAGQMRPPPRREPGRERRSGQAMLETCIVLVLVCLALFGVIEVARLFMARGTVDYASAAGARARAVGFNDFMVEKVVRAAAIPAAGRMTAPGYARSPFLAWYWANTNTAALWTYSLRTTPSSPQYDVERSRIPLYLDAGTRGELGSILDYADWEELRIRGSSDAGALARVRIAYDLPLRLPFTRAFYADETFPFDSVGEIENHAAAYLE